MGWGQEQQAKDYQVKCGTESIPYQYQARLCSGLPGLDAGQRWRGGRLLPWPSVTYLLSPGSPRHGETTACAVAGASRRISQAEAFGATRMAPVCSGSAVLFRPVPGASRERAGCLQELKLLCKEQRRRAEAGRRPRGRPHRGAAAAAAGHRAKLEVGVQVLRSSSVRPAVRASVLAGQRCGA